MTACRLTVGAIAWFPARAGADVLALPVVEQVRRGPDGIDVWWSDGRVCHYLPTDQVDVVEVRS